MTDWCPRCDAVREAGPACPACRTPLVPLAGPRPARAAPPAETTTPAAAPELPPAQPLAARARQPALWLAVLILAAVAFAVGRVTAPPRPTAAEPDRTRPPTTTPPPPRAQHTRQLGWSATLPDGTTLTAVAIERTTSLVPDPGMFPDAIPRARLTLRIEAPGRTVVGLRDVALRDRGGGPFALPLELVLAGGEPLVPLQQRSPGLYAVPLRQAPSDLDALSAIEVGELVTSAPFRTTVRLDAGGPWPDRPLGREIPPPPRGATLREGLPAPLSARVLTARVGGDRALVALSYELLGADGEPFQSNQTLPFTARLVAGGQVVASTTLFFGNTTEELPDPGQSLVVDPSALERDPILLTGPAKPASQLSVELAAGAEGRPLSDGGPLRLSS